ncbi:hypothetical protein B0H63DRAFT_4136 [Podospora didyma]|uniref:Uncharacterized protein n=1 Tax=Podospora didyma TaxID=330526 RepID=A0AAE0P442_9PEZI|nr:hypothetical protein B0H63DRAFT_4136 [Podospora didyma]
MIWRGIWEAWRDCAFYVSSDWSNSDMLLLYLEGFVLMAICMSGRLLEDNTRSLVFCFYAGFCTAQRLVFFVFPNRYQIQFASQQAQHSTGGGILESGVMGGRGFSPRNTRNRRNWKAGIKFRCYQSGKVKIVHHGSRRIPPCHLPPFVIVFSLLLLTSYLRFFFQYACLLVTPVWVRPHGCIGSGWNIMDMVWSPNHYYSGTHGLGSFEEEKKKKREPSQDREKYWVVGRCRCWKPISIASLAASLAVATIQPTMFDGWMDRKVLDISHEWPIRRRIYQITSRTRYVIFYWVASSVVAPRGSSRHAQFIIHVIMSCSSTMNFDLVGQTDGVSRTGCCCKVIRCQLDCLLGCCFPYWVGIGC